MVTARSWGPGDIRIDDIPEPKTRPGTVKVEVEWCGICVPTCTSISRGRPLLRLQALRTRSPARRCRPRSVTSSPGSSTKWVIASMTSTSVIASSSSRTSSVGIATLYQGRYNVCQSLGFVGLSGFGGGFSQFVVAERRWIHPLGDLGTDVGALVEPLAIAHHAVRLSGAKPNHSALVFGAGPIGLVATAALRASGVEQMIVVEPADVRKQMAPIAGARPRDRPEDLRCGERGA
jgi:(R,R)-butanediol dehydrogenase/meso-butanediol dehydrogenase/diacetyl reductase